MVRTAPPAGLDRDSSVGCAVMNCAHRCRRRRRCCRCRRRCSRSSRRCLHHRSSLVPASSFRGSRSGGRRPRHRHCVLVRAGAMLSSPARPSMVSVRGVCGQGLHTGSESKSVALSSPTVVGQEPAVLPDGDRLVGGVADERPGAPGLPVRRRSPRPGRQGRPRRSLPRGRRCGAHPGCGVWGPCRGTPPAWLFLVGF